LFVDAIKSNGAGEMIFLCVLVSCLDFQLASQIAFTKVAVATMPAIASLSIDSSIVESLPTSNVALEVQFGAYLAVALGTLLPCLFLINLFIQTESRKAGREGGIDAE
jgi:photosystem II reaction center protein PsbM